MRNRLLVSTIALWVTILLSVPSPSLGMELTKNEVGKDDEGNIERYFINFSAERVSLFEHNNIDFIPRTTILPYETKLIHTDYGNTFAYGENYQPSTVLSVLPKQSKTVAVNRDGEKAVRVVCGTTKGDLHMTIEPSWSPLGAARFLQLVHTGYFNGCALNRVVPQFLTQLGIGANYEQRTHYRSAANSIPDDDVDESRRKVPFQPGTMAYAGSGPNSRSTEFFIVMPDTPQRQLDHFGTQPWETPFGQVDAEDVERVVGQWYAYYGDMPPWGQGPDPQQIYPEHGYDEYLKQHFPQLDYIETCRIVSAADSDDAETEEL